MCRGFRYEVGISIFESKCVWINGPFPASKADRAIFTKGGLRDKMAAGTKMKGIVDKGYLDKSDELISTHNSLDSNAVSKFKTRTRMRHETWNKRIKDWRCLGQEYRHKTMEKHQILMYAVAVITEYQIEHGNPLFNPHSAAHKTDKKKGQADSDNEESDEES